MDARSAKRELPELLEKYRPVGLQAVTPAITRALSAQAKDFFRVISRVGMGWDNVERQAAAELGIMVYRTAGVWTVAVVELPQGLMLSALRSIASLNPCRNQTLMGVVSGGNAWSTHLK